MNLSDILSSLESMSHAYALEGGGHTRDALLVHLKSIDFDHAGHPDAFVRTYESFGIDESREITIRATRKPLMAPRNIFVLTTPTMTSEAQNALLKTFEEPAASATFFLITPSVEVLLPTLRSRLQVIAADNVRAEEGMISVAEFLAATPAERIKLVEPLLKERKAGDVIAFLGGIERALAPKITDPQIQEGLKAVYRARKYGGDKGALLKALVEHVALLVPRVGA